MPTIKRWWPDRSSAYIRFDQIPYAAWIASVDSLSFRASVNEELANVPKNPPSTIFWDHMFCSLVKATCEDYDSVDL